MKWYSIHFMNPESLDKAGARREVVGHWSGEEARVTLNNVKIPGAYIMFYLEGG